MMYRFMSLTVFCIFTILSVAAEQIIVKAGQSDRQATPVFLDLDQPQDKPICLKQDNSIIPVQIEMLENGKQRIWWIIDQLRANESMQLKIEESESDTQYKQFHWNDNPGQWIDLLYGGKSVIRYMCTPFDPDNIEQTKKTFHHVFDPSSDILITKGAGGRYSHHRGIFFGYSRVKFDDQSYDTWHAQKGEHQLHKKVLNTNTGPVFGSHTVLIHWNDREGKAFIQESRKLRVFRQPSGEWLIDCHSTLKTLRGPIRLDGDRQHAGFQFRASQYVADHQNETRYLRPEKWSELEPDKQYNTAEHMDLPWNALQFNVEDKSFTVAYLSDPENPGNAEFSERLYGRFGEFFPYDLTEDNPLHVHYRFWVTNTRDVSRDEIELRYADLANPPKVEFVSE